MKIFGGEKKIFLIKKCIGLFLIKKKQLYCIVLIYYYSILIVLYDSNKIKSLDIMLPKTSAYVKSYNGQTK